MSERIGELLFTFAHLSVLFGNISGWKLEAAMGWLIYGPSQVSSKARLHTQLVCMDHEPY